MDEEFEQGYGSQSELLPQDGSAGLEADPAEVASPEGDAQAEIEMGVQAFLESGDPQIAVQVVEMLAKTLGLSSTPQAGAGGGAANVPNAAPAPPTPAFKNGGTLDKAKTKPKLVL